MNNQFTPDYAISPGEILEEELELRSMTQRELSEKTGLSLKHISQIINAKTSITPNTALLFERVLGMPARYWLNLEMLYQEALVRIADKEKLKVHAEWFQQFPNAILQKLGFTQKYTEVSDKVDNLLRFFGIGSPDDYEVVWREIGVQYRQNVRSRICPYSSSAWLRAGEIQAHKINCAPYSQDDFKQALEEIKQFTQETDPKIFVPKLVETCSKTGVAVVFVPCFPNTGISGATRWLSPDKAIIQLSLRYKTNDHLWFTFFHEAGHILLHGKKSLHLEYNKPSISIDEEAEANEFAQKQLIPRTVWRQIVEKKMFTETHIREIAKELGIAEGIIVGQLQHHGLIPYQALNHLKVRYTWE